MTPSAASGFLASVADASLRACLLAGVAGLVLLACRVTSAAARLWVWTLVLMAAVAMPILGRAVPGVRWNVPTVAPIARFLAAVVPASPTRLAVESSGSPSSRAADRPRAAGLETVASTSPVAARRSAWPVWALAVYLGGVVLLLLRAGMSWRVTRHLGQSARVIRDSDVLARLQRHAAIAGLARLPRLAESSALRVPVTMAVVKPTIVLPRTWRDWSEPRLDAVLAHELAHVARRDTLTQRLSLLYRAMAWCSPLSWWLHHRLADLAEQASDEAALHAGADRMEYAETLLAFFAELRQVPRHAEWHVAMARGAAVSAERRVDRILTWKGDRSMKLTKRFALGVLLAAAPAAVMTAAVRPSLTTPAPTPGAAAVVPAPQPAMPAAPVVPSTDARPQTGTRDTVYRPGNGVTNPVLIKQVEPAYTPRARQARIQGDVELDAVILPNGKVGDLRVVKSLDKPSGLDQEAIKAAKQWTFRPGVKDGQPVPVRVIFVVTFHLPADAPTPMQASQTPEDDFTRGTYPENTPGLVVPKITYWVEAKYTSAAMRAKIQGNVDVEIVVMPDGTVGRARVAKTPADAPLRNEYYQTSGFDEEAGQLNEEALKAVRLWRFEPGTLRGDAVPVLVKGTLSFRLH